MSYNGSGTFVINTAGQPVVSGTVISSTAFNALTADLATGLSTAITKDGQTTPTANIPMGNNKITNLAVGTAATDAANLSQVQSTTAKLVNSISGADTITGTMSPNLAAYATGQMFYFIAAGDNTGAVTLNIDSLGAKAVTRDGTTALAAGDIQSGEVCVVVYDGTRFQLVNGASQSASIVTENLTVNKATVLNESGGDNDTRIEGDTDANLVFVDASTDRVGVGTNAPTHKFHTNGVVRGAFDDGVFLSSVGASDNYFFSANYSNNNGTEAVTTSTRASWRTSMQIGGAGSRLYKISYRAPSAAAGTWSDFVTVDASGNLGLGVTPSAVSAADKVVQVGSFLFNNNTNGYGILRYNNFYDGTSDKYINTGTASAFQMFGDAFRWYQAASGTAGNTITFTQAMTLDASGNLLVGTTTSNGRLTTKGSGTSSSTYSLACQNSSGTDHFLVRDDGFLIAAQTYNNTNAGAANMYISSGGAIYRSTSSLKYKKNVQNAVHGLAELMTLRPVTYKGVNNGEQVFGGLIAEEVHDAGLTEFVQYADDGSPDALAYGNMVSLAIKAIQEQQAMIDDLKAKVAALEAK